MLCFTAQSLFCTFMLYIGVTHLICLFSTQLTSAQLEHKTLDSIHALLLHQLLCLVFKLQSLVYNICYFFSFGAFSFELPPALQRGTGIPFGSEASLSLESKQETTSAAVEAVPW